MSPLASAMRLNRRDAVRALLLTRCNVHKQRGVDCGMVGEDCKVLRIHHGQGGSALKVPQGCRSSMHLARDGTGLADGCGQNASTRGWDMPP